MNELINEHLEEMLDGYIQAAMWSTNDESDEQGGDPLDKHYSPKDLAWQTRAEMRADCLAFLQEFAEEIDLVRDEVKQAQAADCSVWALAGHDLWLTRCGHGCGFWETSDWPEGLGKLLTHYCRGIGQVHLYVHNGRIYS